MYNSDVTRSPIILKFGMADRRLIIVKYNSWINEKRLHEKVTEVCKLYMTYTLCKLISYLTLYIHVGL